MSIKKFVTLSLFLASVLGAQSALSQAFCALRDPLSVIQQLTQPQPQSFRSRVVDIEGDLATRIAQLAGSIPVNYQELGYHTLYNVSTGNPAVEGIVHVRPEATPWGIAEIAWLLTTEGTILNYEFQRCRSSACATMGNDDVKSLFAGASREELFAMVNSEGSRFLGAPPIEDAGEDELVMLLAMIRSAVKASAVIAILDSR